MPRRMERLTVDLLADLPGPRAGGCGACVFWEHGPVSRGRICGHEAEEKAGWVSQLLREWGSCGRVALVDGSPVGHAIYAPAAYVPGADGFATAPAGSDAVVLTTVYVDPAHRGAGLGRALVQATAADVLGRSPAIRAIEAFGDTWGEGTGCTVPADFLAAVGFKTQRAHTRTPRMRMDLRTTVTWREEFESALDRLLVGIGARLPRPVGRQERHLPVLTGGPRSASQA